MKLSGGIRYNEDGLMESIRAMHVQTELFSISNDNINGFDKIGYQRKEAVVSSFCEVLGVHGLSTTVDDSLGRLSASENPLDMIVADKGYFQYMDNEGVKLTRDGRFKLDKDANLLTLEGHAVLSDAGQPITLHVKPEKLEDISVTDSGEVRVFNKSSQKLERVASLGIVNSEGAAIVNPSVKQGFNEHSNVTMHDEVLKLVPIRRNFEANRQLFIIQNNNLSKAIQELGRA